MISNFLIGILTDVSDELERLAGEHYPGSTEQETLMGAVESLDDALDLLIELSG